jgi:hypothetical protein
MAIEAAALIFHELMHVTGVQIGHSEQCPDASCDQLYMADNTFAWALWTRFPIATLPDCFRDDGASTVNLGRVRDSLFMNPCSVSLVFDCGGSC